jgi:plastocyanin
MKRTLRSKLGRLGLAAGIAVACGAIPARAEVWRGTVGAQSGDLGNQALAFLPNEFWIHVADSIQWNFNAAELHTVTFLHPAQPRPAFPVGCPGVTASGGPFTGANCVNSGTQTAGVAYTVTFPSAGNFKLVCLVHSRMTGTVHVLPVTEMLPHDQAFYDRQADRQRSNVLSTASQIGGEGNSGEGDQGRGKVTAGGAINLGTGGGQQTATVFRFFGGTTVVHVGDTVEWTNPGPPIPHTVTFGTDPANPAPPSLGVTVDSDGARHAMITAAGPNVNSGFLLSPNQETIGVAQTPPDTVRFRVTFTAPGTFNYFCALHDDLGMKGQVIVVR